MGERRLKGLYDLVMNVECIGRSTLEGNLCMAKSEGRLKNYRINHSWNVN
jgi:hypothetical protein